MCPIYVYDYIKQNNMPTIRLRIKFSKTAFLIFCWLWEGVAVERGCGRHLKNSYNACKISWGSQAKMVSKCNRIASLVILNYKIFLGEVPQNPLTRGGQPPVREGVNPPLVLSPPPPPLPSCRRHSMTTNGAQWPYHFLKADDGPEQGTLFFKIQNL